MRFEHGHFIFSELKNENVSFFKAPVTFRGPGLAGTYDPRRKVAGQRWPKKGHDNRKPFWGPCAVCSLGENDLFLAQKQ